jgi:PKHD-type hydroxylase
VQLSASADYDGGNLEFLNAAYDPKALRQQGIIVVFPAYFTHRITPVTRGERIAMVGWIHGDSYS